MGFLSFPSENFNEVKKYGDKNFFCFKFFTAKFHFGMNHRMGQVGGDLKIINPPAGEQGWQPPDRLPRAPFNLALNAFRDGTSTTSMGSLFKCLTTLWVPHFFLTSSLNLSSFSLKPFPLVLSLSNHVKCQLPSCLYTPFKYWKATTRSACSLLTESPRLEKTHRITQSNREASPSYTSLTLSIFLHRRGAPSPALSSSLWPSSRPTGTAGCSKARHSTPDGTLQGQSRGGQFIPNATHLVMQPRMSLAFWTARAHCWLTHSQLSVHQYPQILFLVRAALNELFSQFILVSGIASNHPTGTLYT